MKQKIKQIVCVKWGTAYGPEYVNRLYAMVSRHITGSFRVLCFTDSNIGIRKEVETYRLPNLDCETPKHTAGKWRKLVLWSKSLEGLSGNALFIDLDSVIIGSLDDYFTFGDMEDVVLARNWAKPMQNMGQTSVFRFPVGKYPHVLTEFQADPQGVADRCGFEQHHVTSILRDGSVINFV